ncbi:hypothetical protein I7I50_12020 [Histoplasma capsulatum G186AR]|uniref:Uncharacterized protein n=1 Tax=Ajellomyces capsulatus TaxID=5037 RepID=A0A8H7YB85_AJECA|nr:hypothetical protein I7I52_11705 [Histoplasma capsulatum]QSS70398.1 hypothetical protein I7I50_12020 [Histoplasma capsulatum G186AR]
MTSMLEKYCQYQQYLKIGKGELVLSDFDVTKQIKLFVGEAFCCFLSCVNLSLTSQIKMTTNNLRKHVKKHAEANVADGGWGGGIACDDVDRALAFYKMIIANYENNAVGMTSSVSVMQLKGLSGESIAETEAELAVEKISLPMRKDGKFHNITLVKKIVKD